MKTDFRAEAARTAKKHQKIQAQVGAADKRHPVKKKDKAMQAGARVYPDLYFPLDNFNHERV